MKISVKKFQEGGAMAPDAAAPEAAAAQVQQEDPVMQLAQMAVQALQTQDCNAAMQVCQVFVQMLQQSQGGAPAEEPQGEPVYRRGGTLVRRQKRS